MILREKLEKKIFNNKNSLKNLYALAYNLFKIKLTYYQCVTIIDLLDKLKRNIVISYARQAGKTQAIAVFLALVPIFFDDKIVLVFGPKIEQAQISFNRAIKIIKNNPMNIYSGSITEDKSDRVSFSNNVQIRAVSASVNAEIEGLTADIIIIDECQNVSTFKITESILPMGGATNAKIVLSGVPRAKGSYFHKCWKDTTNFILHKYDWKKCLRPKGVLYKEYCISRLAEDPESFRTQYELKWSDLQSQFVPYEAWDACEIDKIKIRPDDKEGKIFDYELVVGDFLGIDFAKQTDSTVITEGRYFEELDELYVTNMWELKGTAYNEQVNFIVDLFNTNRYQWILADKSSVGDAVIDFMKEAGLPVDGITFDLVHKDKLYKDLRSSILQKKIHWPKKKNIQRRRNQVLHKRFLQQCTDLEVKYRSSGLINVSAPSMSGAHDDFPDSLALLNRCARRFVPPTAYLE